MESKGGARFDDSTRGGGRGGSLATAEAMTMGKKGEGEDDRIF